MNCSTLFSILYCFLFYSVLLCFALYSLLYSIMFCSVLFYSIRFYSIIFYSIFYFVLLYSIFYSVMNCSTLFSILFSILFCSYVFYSILFYSFIIVDFRWNRAGTADRENPCWLWKQSDVTSLSSWGEVDVLTNENSRETPSHRESHCYTPGSAHTHAHMHTFTLQSELHMHIQTDLSGSWVCACWHIYIWVRLSWSALWFGVTGLMPLPPRGGQRRGGRATTWQRAAFHSPSPSNDEFSLQFVGFSRKSLINGR